MRFWERALLGGALLLAGLTIYGLAVMALAVRMLPENLLVETAYYAVAGIAWLWPAAKLTRWMQKAAPYRPPPYG